MDEATRPSGPELDPEQEEIRREIAETRQELGETVEALAGKADVKGQAKAKVGEVRDKVTSASPEQVRQAAREYPIPLALFGALGAGVLIGVLIGRR